MALLVGFFNESARCRFSHSDMKIYFAFELRKDLNARFALIILAELLSTFYKSVSLSFNIISFF